jgi:o-succinylbenzoate synthase
VTVIEALEVIPFALPFSEPYVTSRGSLSRRELVLVRLHCGGETGLGEAVPLALRGGTTLERIVADLEARCRTALEGERLDVDPTRHLEACAAAGASPQAILAVQLALLDLYGKHARRPAWNLLGGIGGETAQPGPVPCNATLSAGEPDRLAEQAREWAHRGFSTFKVKVGTANDREKIAAVREAVGADAKIRIDANGAWRLPDAVQQLRDLESLQIELVEQPVAAEEMAALRRETTTPVAADESVSTLEDARQATARGSCDLATVKLAKVGSLRASFDIAKELPVYLSSALDGPVGIAAAAHVFQTLPRSGIASHLAQGLATSELFADTIASRECRVVDGHLELSEGPGWGVEIDDAALERARL